MKVMVLVKATKESEAGEMPSLELLEAMGKYNEELVEAGIMKAGEGLKPTSAGKRITFRGNDRVVTDGPFAETKELIAGYWLWEVDSMEQAVEWIKKCPNPMKEESDIEIRPLFEMEDFAESDPDGTVMAHEECLRKKIADREDQTAMNPVGWFEIYVQDMARATNFYEAVLDIKLEHLPSPVEEIELMAFPMSMQSSGATGALTKKDGVASGGNSTLVYFNCEDCAIEGSRVVASGGRIQRPKTSLGPYGFMVLAVDTEGNMFGLHSQK
ncbi:YciI family protein [Thalassoglobus polymorphus]|uniref:YCII-related domain protein n=1 Tax=Thalassoglobus polymorphus TaxID=2527994 RepID=A0A517QT03_9PLAN|nr:YciI family protein [Thalassoglobus polymorphus]QDT34759.1 YCII-related domain protein [Thalassoglobus polymorphus]